MTRMVEQYQQLNRAAAAKLKTRLPFYLYKNLADYTKAVGVEGSGGYFDGEKLLAAVHRTQDGAIAPSPGTSSSMKAFTNSPMPSSAAKFLCGRMKV